MMKISKIIFHLSLYYFAWTSCIFLVAAKHPWLATFIVLAITLLQLYGQVFIFRSTDGLGRFMLYLSSCGFILDSILGYSGLILFQANPFNPFCSPPWMLALWLNFSLVFYSTMNSLFKRYILSAALAAIFFPLAYSSGAFIGAAEFPYGYSSSILIGIIWALALPACLYYYNNSGKNYGNS